MTRSIAISLSAATIEGLQGINAALYVLKAVKYGFKGVMFAGLAKTAGYGGGAPLAWQVVQDYLPLTTIQWEPALEAYVSTDPIVDQQRIRVGGETVVDLSQTANVSQQGVLSVTANGGEGAVSILNQGTAAWTCGLAQDAGRGFAPTCAFPLYGGMMDVLTPVDRVLLMFAANLLTAGTVITTAYSNALLVDAAADRAVSYDLNAGWSAGGAAWATSVAAETNLAQLLITT